MVDCTLSQHWVRKAEPRSICEVLFDYSQGNSNEIGCSETLYLSQFTAEALGCDSTN